MISTRPSLLSTLLAGLQPVGIAIAQVLAFFAANHEEFDPQEPLRALGIATGAALTAWLLAWRPAGGARPAALMVSLAGILFWSTTSITKFVTPGDVEPALIAWLVVVIALWGMALPWACRWIARTQRNRTPLYRIFDLASAAGVAVPLLTLVSAGIGFDSESAPPARAAAERASGAADPDIYVIVLDAQGRDDELAEHFGISEGLGARLAELGFYVAEQSRTNYASTLHSLPALLNFDYIQNLATKPNRREMTRLVRRSRIARLLKARGYRFVSYATGINLSEIENADTYLEPPSTIEVFGIPIRINSFEQGLMVWTPLDPLLRGSARLSPYTEHRERLVYTLSDLPRHASDPRPTFVFAHLISPHEPFVFGARGEDVSPHELPFSLARIFEDPDLPVEPGRVGPEYARRYAAQAEYLADLVVEAIREIMERSARPPIVIVQGDHGPYGFSPQIRDARFPILNAYHLPDGGARRLYPTISPVNSLRVVLNHYFDAGLPMRPDRSFRSSWKRPAEFSEVPPEHAPAARNGDHRPGAPGRATAATPARGARSGP